MKRITAGIDIQSRIMSAAPHIIDYSDERKILDELHQYFRSCMTLWVQWFTFFVTVNYLALGWFAQEIVKSGSLKDARPLKYVAILFISQCLLGIWVSLLLRQWFLRTDKELSTRYEILQLSLSRPVFLAQFYSNAISLACVALAALILCWILLAVRP